ncbi:hypothetical protein M422DRAFT_267761 [Sphaerobolus stellatus SS14]|uniref:DUF4100 domain-containing protein n=1 Tax=Sphaerobolus stellatus (strain SS14) TaxID=990650 RepID=A0A0C9UP69_SPHS4|nr:hypothetical protein M422DRAFT_267761 [Sphaerobolus stellatus SS14]
MSGEDADARQTLVTHIKPMPVPRSVGAPTFNGRYVHDFLSTVEILGKNAGLTPAELPKRILPYCTDTYKISIEWADEFNGTNWEAAKVFLIELYESSDQGPIVSIDQLRTYIRESKSKPDFVRRIDLDRYHQDFLAIAGQLKKRGIMDKKEMELKFFGGLPKGIRVFVSSQLPSENKVTTKPPSISQVIKTINCRFDPNCSEFLELDETFTVKPKSDIEALAQQLEQLTINQAQTFTALQSLSIRPSNSMTNTGRCFICGLTGTHQLHPRHCPETKNLLNEGLIKFDVDKRRYTLLEGSDLPILPASVGSVAAYLRQQASTKTASTSNVSLMFGASQALGGQIIGISAEDYNQYLGSAVTRTGHNTSNRADPYKRPEANGKPQNLPGAAKKMSTDVPATVQIPASNPQPKPQVNIPPPPPINTREGWKESRGNKDVNMKDDLKRGPQFHFTSDVQEQASVENIERFILDQTVSLSLHNILGVSPALQKRIQELMKTRHKYVTKTGEYDLYSPEAEQLLSQNHTASTSEAHLSRKIRYVPETDEFQKLLVRHSNAVALHTFKLLAMTTGIFLAKLYSHTVKFMVDCGSELNLFPDRLLSLPGMTLDYEGSKWSLKGVNGGPSQLRGCSMDTEIELGGHRFDHHFFVTQEDMTNHDVILGQPWLQGYTARMDYDREGMMTLQLWKDGDRSHRPTISVVLTRPDNARNDIAGSHTHQASAFQMSGASRVEEVADEDF